MIAARLMLLAALFAVIFSITACDRPVNRNLDPLVFRSVLDWEPRIITIQLGESFWIAYDAKHASLFKVWRDGVKFDGPVYTSNHGPQPITIGPAWMVNPFREPWRLVVSGDTLTPHVQYRGHVFDDSRVHMNYEIKHPDGGVIRVSERPDWRTDPSGHPVLDRTFGVSGVPEGTTLLLRTHFNGLEGPDPVSSAGGLSGIRTGSEWNGWLALNPDRPTTLTAKLTAQPTVIRPKDVDMRGDVPYGLTLIKASDCSVCHNRDVATVGPAYGAIADHYRWTLFNVEKLSARIINGGSGIWGERVMTAHPALKPKDVSEMVRYILSLDGEVPPSDNFEDDDSQSFSKVEIGSSTERANGLIVNTYRYDELLDAVPTPSENQFPVFSGIISKIHARDQSGFGNLRDNFSIHARGTLHAPVSGTYTFRLVSDDGSILTLDERVLIDHDGTHSATPKNAVIDLDVGGHAISVDYFQGPGGKVLSLQWVVPGTDEFAVIPTEAFTFDLDDLKETRPDDEPPPPVVIGIPGDGRPLDRVHPSFSLSQARPESFEPMVAGMDFLPDGRLVVSTWDPEGSVYILEGNTVKRVAKGLAEPLGLKIVDGEIFIMQKQELTKLIDHDGDELIDEYYTVSNAWGVSANFHEFSFGLAYRDGYFYATLATAVEPGGASTSPQIPDRGKVVKIDEQTGATEFIAHGLRTPNGIGLGLGEQLFVADNQGDWLPASKILHVQEGAWYGSRSVDYAGTADLEETPPVVWLPHDEIGNSPSTPVGIEVGPYAGQLIHGDVTHGGIKRVFVEEIEGRLQGAVFRFTQGLEAGINRLVWSPAGALYAGGIGNPGNWGQDGKLWHGLQRLTYNGKTTFEMLALRALSDGLEIEFTDALRRDDGWSPDDYQIKQWWYKPTASYGGPKMDETVLSVRSVHVSDDRRRVFLEISGLEEGHVVYVRLRAPLVSESGLELWSTEAWYTLNRIPSGRQGFRSASPVSPPAPNTLTEREIKDGWRRLFDGEGFAGWHRYGGGPVGSAWRVMNGAIALVPGTTPDWKVVDGGDILTDEAFENFELSLECKISPGGNSGIFYLVTEGPEYAEAWETAPEMQFLDTERHSDGRYAKHRAGDLYDLIEADFVATREVGEWNHVRIIVNHGEVEHWLNGRLVLSYRLWTDEWEELIAASKFAGHEEFARGPSGRIGLQEHDDRVWFRNIKIRRL